MSLQTENELGKQTLTTFNQNFGLEKLFSLLLLQTFIQLNAFSVEFSPML